jgi:hypothetical protein
VPRHGQIGHVADRVSCTSPNPSRAVPFAITVSVKEAAPGSLVNVVFGK